MTQEYENVYINDTATISGPYESKGPLSNFFDKNYNDLYFGSKSWENAEIKMLGECIDILLQKTKKKISNIDALISGDLLNQIVSSSFNASKVGIPFIGIYAAGYGLSLSGATRNAFTLTRNGLGGYFTVRYSYIKSRG